jgi:hypothetical protein
MCAPESYKLQKFFNSLTKICQENMTPDVRSLHAALIFSGNKIISSGYNSLSREGTFGRHTKAEHAEVAACRNYSRLGFDDSKKSYLLRGNT